MTTKPEISRATVAAGVAFTGFATVLSAIEFLAVHGQLDFAQHIIHLAGGYRFAVPVALEAGGLTFGGLTLWATLHREHAPVSRVMTIACVMAASAASWIGSRAAGLPVVGALYLAAASVFALVMWREILRRLRRSQLHAAGRVAKAPPLRPRFGAARWLIDPAGTGRAWRVAVLAGESDAAKALALASRDRAVRSATGETAAKVAAALEANPAISNADLAKAAGVAPNTLYRFKAFREARRLPLAS